MTNQLPPKSLEFYKAHQTHLLKAFKPKSYYKKKRHGLIFWFQKWKRKRKWKWITECRHLSMRSRHLPLISLNIRSLSRISLLDRGRVWLSMAGKSVWIRGLARGNWSSYLSRIFFRIILIGLSLLSELLRNVKAWRWGEHFCSIHSSYLFNFVFVIL